MNLVSSDDDDDDDDLVYMGEPATKCNNKPKKAHCPICKHLVAKQYLKTHIKRIHEDTQKCAECNEVGNYKEMRS